jgi:hypothetical protein
LANGQIITSPSYAVLTVDKSETVDEVVFAETGDLNCSARALEGLNLQWMLAGKAVAAGPIVAAAVLAIGRLVQVPPTPKTRERPDEGPKRRDTD